MWLTLSGQCTSTGLIYLYIGGERVACKAIAGEALTATATRLTTIINATPTLPVHANSIEGVITLTCKWGGTTGNDIDLRVKYRSDETTPKGLTITCVPFKNGAGNPDMAPIITA
ncbi:MAG: phage tail protein, partial [Desulfovibrionaceae bacterium]